MENVELYLGGPGRPFAGSRQVLQTVVPDHTCNVQGCLLQRRLDSSNNNNNNNNHHNLNNVKQDNIIVMAMLPSRTSHALSKSVR
jgi:hypothetical protein